MVERRRSYRALVVEDDAAILTLVKRVLEREQFTVEGVKSGRDAIAVLQTAVYDLLILDLILPQISGEEVLDWIEGSQPHTLRRVIVTTTSPRHVSCEFLERICRLLEKPFNIDQLVLYARECTAGEVA